MCRANVKIFFKNMNKMRQKFNDALYYLLKNKREDNKSFLNKEEYVLRLQRMKLAKEKLRNKWRRKV